MNKMRKEEMLHTVATTTEKLSSKFTIEGMQGRKKNVKMILGWGNRVVILKKFIKRNVFLSLLLIHY